MADSDGVVFSTEYGRMCPSCGKPKKKCICKQKKKYACAENYDNGKVCVFFDKKGRKGKGMTIVSGLNLNGLELMNLARELKLKCGVGGTVKRCDIELQGDRVDFVKEDLRSRGLL